MKLTPQLKMWTAIFSIGLLILPILAMDYVDDRKLNEYFEIDPDGFNYSTHNPGYINTTLFYLQENHPNDNFYGNDTNPDLVGYDNAGNQWSNFEFAQNSHTYLGNATYKTNISALTYKLHISIPLDINKSALIELDYIRVTIYDYLSPNINLYAYDNDDHKIFLNGVTTVATSGQWTTVFALSTSYKSFLNSLPHDGMLWLTIGGVPDEFTWTVEKLEVQDTIGVNFEIEDTTYFYIIISLATLANVIVCIFLTDTVDLVIDKKRKKFHKQHKN